MSTVVLVSCSAGKEAKPMPAEKLYNSDLFKKQMEYAKKLAPDNNVYIISAKYHLVPLNKTDAVLYPVSELTHYTSKLTGTKPRMFWCFGYCIPIQNTPFKV